MNASTRLPIIGVIGSGRDPYPELAVDLGRRLALRPVHLLTGGGAGVMLEVGQAFCSVPTRRGLHLGIIPSASAQDRIGHPPDANYPNPTVEVVIQTHLSARGLEGNRPLSRNHINVLTSDIVIALPGGPGTWSEMQLAFDYGRPLIAFLSDSGQCPGLSEPIRVANRIEEVEAFLDEHLEPI